MVGKALLQLADACICASNDFHTLHFNYKGEEFDRFHRKVLKKYYEQAGDDYDELVEKALMWEQIALNANEAALRIGYKSFEGLVNREVTIARCEEIISTLVSAMYEVYSVLNEQDCPMSVGVSNYLQTRLEYWTKELKYFNRHRSGGFVV